MSDLQSNVQDRLEGYIDRGDEHAVQVALYVDGVQVLNVAAGECTTDSLFCAWSVTKGIVATALHLLVDRGQVDYDHRIGDYWPEFAAHGKESVTLRHALTHCAGIPHMPPGCTPEQLCDWDLMCDAIAKLEPLWRPGSQTGYHFWTFGWIVGEVIRRVSGQPLEQFIAQEVCEPLGIRDFHLGIDDAAAPRVVPLREDRPTVYDGELSDLYLRAAPPALTSAAVLNRPEIQRACIPGCGGITSADAIASHYALLAGGGEFGGRRLLSRERINTMRELQTDALDQVAGKRYRKGLGYFLGGDEALGGDPRIGDVGGEFGHPGYSRAIGFADPERNLAFGLTKSTMNPLCPREKSVAYVLAEMVRTWVDAQRPK